MFELMDTYGEQAVIKVIGVGGGGGNAVDHMVNASIEGVEFIIANTDAQALKKSGARTVLQLGSNLTKGLGAGADPAVGRQAAGVPREGCAVPARNSARGRRHGMGRRREAGLQADPGQPGPW